MRGESMPEETIFLEWAPGKNKKPKVKKGTKLAKPEEIQRAINESTRAAISPDGWKLCLRNTDKNELYNWQRDPNEEQNLYDSRDQRDVIARLTGEIHRWQESVGDTLKI